VENRKKSISRKTKTLGQYEADAKNLFKVGRLRDANENCISCSGKTFGMEDI
jgi:hypothetical protein